MITSSAPANRGNSHAQSRDLVVEIPPLEELLLHFESFGDNCEFGVMQRQAGIEPLGLLRFSTSSLAAIMAALDSRFDGVGEFDKIEITTSPTGEFMINIMGYNFKYHTRRYKGQIEPDALCKEEAAKQKFLVRRLISTLNEGNKIVVRRGPPEETLEDAKALLAALRGYGPVTLLWVTREDEKNPARSVRLVAPNLIRGRLGKLTPYHDAHNLEFTSWVDICRGAYSLWKNRAPVGAAVAAPVRNDHGSNLFLQRQPNATSNAEPRVRIVKKNIEIHTVCGSFPWRNEAAHTICRNTLSNEHDGLLGANVSGVVAGQVYTFSLWIQLERGGQINATHVFFLGCKSERRRRIQPNAPLTWQQFEVSAVAPSDGMLYPRLLVKGVSGGAFYAGNWRLEPGIILGEVCAPGRYPPEPKWQLEILPS